MTKTTTPRSSAVQPAAEQGEAIVIQHVVTSGDREMKVCVCYPAGYWPVSAGAPLLPWMLYLHAGGFVDGGVEAAKELARDLAEHYPIALVNSVNPVRLQGQKTAAFEIVDALGDAPDIHCLPVGNAGNISAY